VFIWQKKQKLEGRDRPPALPSQVPPNLHGISVLYIVITVDEKKFPHPPQGKTINNYVFSTFCHDVKYYFVTYVDNYYVVDVGYPNRPNYLDPYKGKRYHISKWQIQLQSLKYSKGY
jgi:hypothetical protein